MKLYKFKSLENEGFFYFVDMIVNHRVYLPMCDQINDPEEGTWGRPGLSSSGWAVRNAPAFSGDEYLQNAKELRSVMKYGICENNPLNCLRFFAVEKAAVGFFVSFGVFCG